MNTTTLRYKIPKQEKLKTKKIKKETEKANLTAILEPQTPSPKKLIIALEKKFDKLSDTATTALTDALDAHSYAAQIKNPVLRESCHESINAETHRQISTTITEVDELQKDIPQNEKKLGLEIKDYRELLVNILSDKPANKNIDTDVDTHKTTPSITPRLGG